MKELSKTPLIPKKIHYCWYGPNKKSQRIQDCIKSWEKILKGYEIICWDEGNTPFKEIPVLRRLYNQEKWSFLSDYMRLYVLYHFGGIYFDTDIEVIKNFDTLLDSKGFIGFQLDPKISKTFIGAGVIGAEKKNSTIEELLKLTETKQRLTLKPVGGPFSITPYFINKGVNSHEVQAIDGFHLYTKDYFYPFYMDEIYTSDCLTRNTYCLHYWDGEWQKKGKNYHINKIKFRIQSIPWIIKNYFLFYFQRHNFFHYVKLYS